MKHYFNIWWRFGLSFFGAAVLIFAAEKDPPWVVIRDDDFFWSYTVAWFSVYFTLVVQEFTLKAVDRIVPFRRRTKEYYIDRYILQFFLSTLPTLLCAVAMAFVWTFAFMDILLWETYYFHYDIYIVGTGVLAVQIIVGLIHYSWSRDQFEEVDLVSDDDGLAVYQCGGIPRELNTAVREYLVQHIDDSQTDGAGSEPLRGQPYALQATKKDRLQWEEIHRLDWATIAAFYSMHNSTYLVRWNGEVMLLDASLSNIKRQMDVDLYFSGAKSFIIHFNAVVRVTKIGNGQVKLMVEPVIPVEAKLSRNATQQFRKWYLA